MVRLGAVTFLPQMDVESTVSSNVCRWLPRSRYCTDAQMFYGLSFEQKRTWYGMVSIC